MDVVATKPLSLPVSNSFLDAPLSSEENELLGSLFQLDLTEDLPLTKFETDNIASVASFGSNSVTNDFTTHVTSFDFGAVKKRLQTVKPKLFIQNVVSCVQIHRKLDKQFILSPENNNSKIYAKKKFAALIHKRPNTTALIFTTGKLVITGAKSEKESESEAQAHIDMLREIYKHDDNGFDSFNFKIHNIVASGTTSYAISISRLHRDYPVVCQYEPENFPGAIFRMEHLNITLLIFASGKIVISGAKSVENVKTGFDSIVEILNKYKNTTSLKKKGKQ
jgi:transcription initiation factor TFIID TATA-box-binding protein